jgi:hypothetical protein
MSTIRPTRLAFLFAAILFAFASGTFFPNAASFDRAVGFAQDADSPFVAPSLIDPFGASDSFGGDSFGSASSADASTPLSVAAQIAPLPATNAPEIAEFAASGRKLVGFLTLQTLSSLTRYGLTVSEENVRVGMSRAELSHHCALWSISPLMLSDRIQNDKELAVSLHDLSALVPHLPSPRHLWLDDALTIHIPLPEWIDAVHDKDDTTIPSDASTCIVIGGDKFIQKIVAAAKKRQL